MKIVLILTLIFMCGTVGYGLSGVYKQRKKFYEAYAMFLLDLKTDIGFSANKLSEIIQTEKNSLSNKDFSILLDNYLKTIKSEEVLTKESLFLNIKLLNDQEKNDIYSFFKGLGKTDIYNQIETIKNRYEATKNYCDKLTKECEKYCPLYTKLSILVGLFMALIII